MTIENKNKTEHDKQIDSLKNLYNNEKKQLDTELENCNIKKKHLMRVNNKLVLKNKTLQNNYDENDTIRQQQCDETLRKEKLRHENIIQSIKSMAGGFKNHLNNFENKISGGIIGQIKKNLKIHYNKEHNNFKNLQNLHNLHINNQIGGTKQKGGNPLVFMAVSAVKIVLITIGTFIFDWWPIMMLLSLYCVYIEYKMIKLSGEPILGLPIAFLLGAYLCPCIWVIVRVVMGWNIGEGKPQLFNIFSKCTNDGITVNFHEYYGTNCKNNKCIWTTNECYDTLFGKKTNTNSSSFMGNFGF